MHVARRPPWEREVKLASKAKVEVRKQPRSGRQSRVYAAKLLASLPPPFATKGSSRSSTRITCVADHSPCPRVRYWEDWFEIQGGPLARAYHLLQKIDLGPKRNSERGPLLEFNIGSHPGDSTHYVNAKDMLSLSLLQARLIDLGMPIKIVEGT